MNTEPTELKIKDNPPEITTKINKFEAKIEDAKKELDDLLVSAIKNIEANATNNRNLADAIYEMSASTNSVYRYLKIIKSDFSRALNCKL